MSNESTTSTLDDITQAAVIDPLFHDYGHQYLVADPFLKSYDLQGKGSKTIQVPSLTSVIGSPATSSGTAVDGEFDASEATDISNTERGTDKKTIASTEYGVMFTVTDNVLEDSVSGLDIVSELVNDAARILNIAWEYDVIANFTNFSNSVGTQNQPMTLANMSSALVNLRNEGIHASGGVVYVLGKTQAEDYEDGLTNTNSATAVLPGTADSFYNAVRDPDNGLNNGLLGSFRGNPVYMTHLAGRTDGDEIGACFVPVQANARMAALGKTISRPFRIETQRTPEGRGTKIVCTMRMGSGELLDEAGCKIVTREW